MIGWCVSIDEFEETDFPVIVGYGVNSIGGSVLEGDVVGSSGKVHPVEAGDVDIVGVATDSSVFSSLGPIHKNP
jgi:hypothetical protein